MYKAIISYQEVSENPDIIIEVNGDNFKLNGEIISRVESLDEEYINSFRKVKDKNKSGNSNEENIARFRLSLGYPTYTLSYGAVISC